MSIESRTYAEACASYERLGSGWVWVGEEAAIRQPHGAVLVSLPTGGFAARSHPTGHTDPILRGRFGNQWESNRDGWAQLGEFVARRNRRQPVRSPWTASAVVAPAVADRVREKNS